MHAVYPAFVGSRDALRTAEVAEVRVRKVYEYRADLVRVTAVGNCGDRLGRIKSNARGGGWKGAKKERPRLCETCPNRADAAVLRARESCVHTLLPPAPSRERTRCGAAAQPERNRDKGDSFPRSRSESRQLHRTTLRHRRPERYETPERCPGATPTSCSTLVRATKRRDERESRPGWNLVITHPACLRTRTRTRRR